MPVNRQSAIACGPCVRLHCTQRPRENPCCLATHATAGLYETAPAPRIGWAPQPTPILKSSLAEPSCLPLGLVRVAPASRAAAGASLAFVNPEGASAQGIREQWGRSQSGLRNSARPADLSCDASVAAAAISPPRLSERSSWRHRGNRSCGSLVRRRCSAGSRPRGQSRVRCIPAPRSCSASESGDQ